ncbi:MAG: DUF1028 domain-containing protein [Gemmatimonadales bacterium]
MLRSVMLVLCTPLALVAQDRDAWHTTYSIIAFDSATGDVGVAVQSKAPWVSSAVAHAVAGVGGVATQSFTRYAYGPELLDLLARGASPAEALAMRVRADDGRERRQVGVLDVHCRREAYTGGQTFVWAGSRGGHANGACYQAQGNLLDGAQVVDSMVTAFERTPGPLVDRLMAALHAAEAAGGDARGRQSAAILVVRPGQSPPDERPYLRLQVDDALLPLPELQRLVNVWKAYQAMGASNRWRRAEGGNLDSALAYARHATTLAADLDVAWVQVAAVHLDHGREREARDALRTALGLNARLPRVINEYPVLTPFREQDRAVAVRILRELQR